VELSERTLPLARAAQAVNESADSAGLQDATGLA
jgi:hypothetical protein